MKKIALIVFILCLLVACRHDDLLSPDLDNPGLLPDRGDYLDEDYGTQDLAEELEGVYDCRIGMVYYDPETRTIPQLYLTGGDQAITITALPSGAVEVSFGKFSTEFMPLQLSVTVKTLPEAEIDTIFLHGTDGKVRTGNEGGEIGVPLPESDDGELTGTYVRSAGAINMQIDLMLPIPVKASVSGRKTAAGSSKAMTGKKSRAFTKGCPTSIFCGSLFDIQYHTRIEYFKPLYPLINIRKKG